MTKIQKFKILNYMFFNKVAVGAKYKVLVSVNKFTGTNEKVYVSGFKTRENLYKVATEERIVEVLDIFLEEGFESKDRVSIQGNVLCDMGNNIVMNFRTNYDVMELKGKRIE